MIDRIKCKQFAKAQLKNRWTIPVLVTLFTIIISIIFSASTQLLPINELFDPNLETTDDIFLFLQTFVKSSSIIYLISIVEAVISLIIQGASTNLYLKMSRSPEKITMTPFIEGFSFAGRSLLAGLWVGLWSFLWYFAAIFAMALLMVIFSLLGDTFLILAGCIGVIGAVIILLYKLYSYSMTLMIAIEFPEVSITRALDISKKITKGNIWELFVLELSFMGWMFLSIFTIFIGVLWLEPYMQMTTINAYHSLLKDALKKGIVKVEDLSPKSTTKEESSEENEKAIIDDQKSIESSESNSETNFDSNNDTNKDL